MALRLGGTRSLGARECPLVVRGWQRSRRRHNHRGGHDGCGDDEIAATRERREDTPVRPVTVYPRGEGPSLLPVDWSRSTVPARRRCAPLTAWTSTSPAVSSPRSWARPAPGSPP